MRKKITQSSKMIMVTGMARSGTTLLAECLNHHPKIMCVADPMNEFFKGFLRFAYKQVENEEKSITYPLDNYFFSGSLKVKEFLDQTDLKHKIPDYLKKEMIARIIRRDGQFCPEIIGPLKNCRADTFESFYLEIIEILYSIWGTSETEWLGIKTAWCEQMILPLSKTFPNMSFIQIIRDPRAVVTSNYLELANRYPLLFNIRDWRKSVYYAWKFSRLEPICKKFSVLRYADLVDNPTEILSRVTENVGIGFDSLMIETQFKRPNTSHGKVDEQGISKAFKEKWKDALPNDLIRKIECFAAQEMRQMHFDLVTNPEIDLSELLSLEDIPYSSLSKWCKDLVQSEDYYKNTWLVHNTLLELARLNLIKAKEEASDTNLLNQFFYEKEYYLDLRNNCLWENHKNFITKQKA